MWGRLAFFARPQDGGAFFLLAMLLLGVPALLMVVSVVVPRYVQRTRTVLQAHPLRSLLIGLLNLVVFIGLAMLLGSLHLLGVTEPLAMLLFLALLLGLACGLPAVAAVVGEGVWRLASGKAGSPLLMLLVGAVLLVLLLLVLVVGWVVLFVLLAAGLGAAVTALVLREGQRQDAPPPA